MDHEQLDKLVLQIESLLLAYEKLRTENHSLRQKLIKITKERAELVDKNEKAAGKIKRIISNLRSEVQ